VPVADIDDTDDTDQDTQETAQPESVVTPAPVPVRESAPAPAPSAPSEPQPNAADDKTLRLILQELRSQRGIGEEFSYTRIMAIVLQTVAGACLLGAFWLGSADAVVFLRLIGSAILAQLAVITALLWDRR
jgi:hypothetical protein